MMRSGITGSNEQLNAEALECATAYAQSIGIDKPLHTLRVSEPISWVYTDGNPHNTDPAIRPTVAIRLGASALPEQLLRDTQHDVRLTQAVRQLTSRSKTGTPQPVPVQSFVAAPQLYGGFVATASEYLPHSLGSWHGYGVALGQLRNATEEHSEITRQAHPFNPLASLHKSYNYLIDHAEEVDVSKKLLEVTLPNSLAEGNRKVEEMLQLSEDKKRPLSIVQSDVTPANARRNRQGTTTLIDLDMMQGPAEYSLGRPLGQWTNNFKRPRSWGKDLQQGYLQASVRPPDDQILERALFVSRLEHASSPLRSLVKAVMQQVQPNPWALHESERRLENLDTPHFHWTSLEAYLKGEAPELTTYAINH